MKPDTANATEMKIDDGDNLVGTGWSQMVNNNPALRQAVDEQGTRWMFENAPRILATIGQLEPRVVTSNYAPTPS